MIIVKVELHSAITHKITELARMKICNDGTSAGSRRSYIGTVFRGRSKEQLDKETIHKERLLGNWPAEQLHVWNLVARFLNGFGYQ